MASEGVKSPRQANRKGKKSSESFGTYIYKILKQVHPNTGMSGDAKRTLDRMIHIIFNKINVNLKSIMESADVKTLTSKHIQNAVRMTLSGELANQAIKKGTKAITKYHNTAPRKGQSQATRAWIQFSVSRTRHLLGTCYRIGKGAPVYLATVLEYLVASILELAGYNARDAKRARINTEHMFAAIKYDVEINQLFQDVYIVGGGYEMFKLLHTADRMKKNVDVVNKKNKNKRRTTPRPGHTHRFLYRNVGKTVINQQLSRGKLLHKKASSGKLRFPAGPFRRVVNEIQQDFAEDIKITKDARVALQHFIEHHTIDQLEMAGRIANNSGREAVQTKDLQLARLSMGLRF